MSTFESRSKPLILGGKYSVLYGSTEVEKLWTNKANRSALRDENCIIKEGALIIALVEVRISAIYARNPVPIDAQRIR